MLTISNINNNDFSGNAIVYRTKDRWGDIMVIDKNNYRVLAFDPIYEQSSIDLKKLHIPVHEYTQIMLLVLAFINPDHITILGLGGGGLLHALHYLIPRCMLLCIEMREKVVEIAINFFLIPIYPNINIMISDAKLAIQRCEARSTQIIFSDMYQSYGMNSFQIQKQFIQQCHRILDDTGWLVVNYHQMPELNSIFIQCLQRYFLEIFVCQSFNGNYILFAGKGHVATKNKHQTTVLDLEKKLGIDLMHLFKRIRRLQTRVLIE